MEFLCAGPAVLQGNIAGTVVVGIAVVLKDWGSGYIFHADFVSGWDEQILNDIIQRCKAQ
jgi:hypothetical protein